MEWGFAKGGINGTKWVVGEYLGYAPEKRHCGRPYPQFADPKKQAWICNVVRPLLEDERKLGSNLG
jgi:4-hydroxy-2-oxoglutarate aldolase